MLYNMQQQQQNTELKKYATIIETKIIRQKYFYERHTFWFYVQQFFKKNRSFVSPRN